MSKTSVFGIVKTHSQAEQIVESLQSAGFAASEISVLLPDNQSKHDIGHVKATKAPEGATAGAATGGVTGGVLGLLAGIGALAIPGVGPFIAAGPIMAALSGAAIGATTGGVVGGLVGMGMPEIEAKRYEDKLRSGNYLIAVDVADGNQKNRAKEIFKNAGAEDISTLSMSKTPAEARA
jgi:Heat induced stress protein YflT domain